MLWFSKLFISSLQKDWHKSILKHYKNFNVFIFQLIHSRKKASREYDIILEEGKEAHWEVVERILFIYAKLNPGTGYVQGMNELVGPLYYTLASDPNIEWRSKFLKF